jgi:hypothetical protein
VVSPILDHIWKLERENPDETVVVLIPQLIEAHWCYSFLHNQRATILRNELLLKGENRILIVNVPWQIEKHPETGKRSGEAAHQTRQG